MTWNSPRTWDPGDLVIAAVLDEQLRDNLKAIGDPWAALPRVDRRHRRSSPG